MNEFLMQQAGLAKSVHSGEIERADGEMRLLELRAGLEERLSAVLQEEQMQRFLDLMPPRDAPADDR